MSSRRILQKKQKKRISKTGLPPGTNLYTGSKNSEKSEIDVYSYSPEHCDFYRTDAETLVDMELSSKLWINVNGISSPETIKLICDKFKVHYLYQEDIMNVFQRPKIEEEDTYIFVTFKSLEWNDKLKEVDEEQISAIISKNVLITFQEKPGDGYDILRDRLKVEHSVIRERETDYFFYRLIDITVDTYFDILEKMGDYLEDIENQVLNQPDNEVLLQIQNNKKEIMQLRKSVYPMRDMLNKIILSEHLLIEDKTKKYFKDVLDHTIQVMDTVETYRDINVGLKDVYLNTMSHEMNRIMKILTIISTFFIPLTFIVGVYGMNFKYMPELEWQIGYYLVWLIMLIIVIGLTIWFKRKAWF